MSMISAVIRRHALEFGAAILAVGVLATTPVFAETNSNSKLNDRPEANGKIAPQPDGDAAPPPARRWRFLPPQGALPEPPGCPTNTDKLELLV